MCVLKNKHTKKNFKNEMLICEANQMGLHSNTRRMEFCVIIFYTEEFVSSNSHC